MHHRAASAQAVAFVLLLGGCYDSKADLIGDHAVTVRSLDSVLVYKGMAYFATKVGTEVTLCHLRTRADVMPSCPGDITLKVERTMTGNYIVQARERGVYYYALWARSEPGTAAKAGSVCAMWLGEGIIGKNVSSSVPYLFDRNPVYNAIAAALAPFQNQTFRSRDEMLKVVDAYETNAANADDNKWLCIGERTLMIAAQPIIAGDNRNQPDFTNTIK